MDSSFLSPVSALLGGLAGGGASLIAAVYTQRFQGRHHRTESEVTKRETIYAEFLMSASNILLKAYTQEDITLGGDEQRLIGLINRMRLFAPAEIISAAEEALRAILQIALQPSTELRQLATRALSKDLGPDPLVGFAAICRAELDRMH